MRTSRDSTTEKPTYVAVPVAGLMGLGAWAPISSALSFLNSRNLHAGERFNARGPVSVYFCESPVSLLSLSIFIAGRDDCDSCPRCSTSWRSPLQFPANIK